MFESKNFMNIMVMSLLITNCPIQWSYLKSQSHNWIR